MKITDVKYSKKFNIGNYESEEFGLSAQLDPKDDAMEVIEELKEKIAASQSNNHEKDDKDDDSDDADQDIDTDESDSDDGADAEEDTEEETDEEEAQDEEEEVDEEEVEEEKPAKAKKSKFKSKPESYDRANKVHKEQFAKALSSVFPDWKKSAKNKALAVTISKKLVGYPLLDADGKVLAEFKTAIKKLLK